MTDGIFIAIPEIVYGEVRWGVRRIPPYDLWVDHEAHGSKRGPLWDWAKEKILGGSSFQNHAWKKDEQQKNRMIDAWREMTGESPELAIKYHGPKSGILNVAEWPQYRDDSHFIEVTFYINNLDPVSDYEKSFGFEVLNCSVDLPAMSAFLEPKDDAFYSFRSSKHSWQPDRELLYQKSRIEYITFAERIVYR